MRYLILWLAITATHSQAAEFQKAWRALFSERYPAAIAEAEALQTAGDARGDFLLGYMHLFGKGLEQDAVKAEALFQKASKAGFNGATYRLGKMYREGHPGVPQNTQQALLLLQKAADKGGPNAQFQLAQMLEFGEGTQPDLERAIDYYQRAANKKHAYARWNLAYFYQLGRVVEQDSDRAATLYELALAEGAPKWLGVEINRRLEQLLQAPLTARGCQEAAPLFAQLEQLSLDTDRERYALCQKFFNN